MTGSQIFSAAAAQAGRTLRHQVTERIKDFILENELRPGDALPTETELCVALGVSRSSIREAIKTLNALDIVEVRHGHGTYVGKLSLSALVESLTFRGLLSPDDFQALSDLIDARELIERGLADRITDALTPEHLDALDGLVADMAARGGHDDGFVETCREFHALLVRPLGNELISQLSGAFWEVYRGVAPHLRRVITVEDEIDSVEVHRDMARAARSGDVTAFMVAVTEHYAPVRRRISLARVSLLD
ncbi:putative GntR-family transcriptional regulator [Alloactinosynnema sp. L-07]|uniref:FadR/GntR family transcriptional regulator n=1 Tax=Alloactinosynnema sp. L-07 TaxID=1653480 RepID=UPI00065EF012|nr:GntR family transcriptional regulator [Alloactinosynnema sp. L-07]CRK62223.1 putative GntR-family transcriptional regulator [Alloactinosynnema sp. L-07]